MILRNELREGRLLELMSLFPDSVVVLHGPEAVILHTYCDKEKVVFFIKNPEGVEGSLFYSDELKSFMVEMNISEGDIKEMAREIRALPGNRVDYHKNKACVYY